MKLINEVTQALSADYYVWPQVVTEVTQWGGRTVSIDLDMCDLRHDLVKTFVEQFHGTVTRRTATRVEVMTMVGRIDVQITVKVAPEYDTTNQEGTTR